MALNIISRVSPADQLKASLDIGAERVRASAERVSRASVQQKGFSLPAAAAPSNSSESEGPLDLDVEMANLADEQLRYEATAKLLSKTYAGLRASLRDK
jgi:flagellar basal body rod protein FlgB